MKYFAEVRDAIFVCMYVDRLVLLKEMYSFAENYFKIQQIVVSKKLLPIHAQNGWLQNIFHTS